MTTEFSDPLHQQSAPGTVWTTVNTAEALPGVPTPLGWTLWNHRLERAMRGAFCDIGVLAPSDIRVPERIDDRYSAIFYGRFSANVDQMRAIGDLMPGTSGDALEQQLLGAVHPGAVSNQSRRRYPVVGVKMPRAALAVPKVLRRRREEIDAWWKAAVGTDAGPDTARARFAQAIGYFEAVMRPHAVVTMLTQALYEQLTKLAATAGRPGLEIRLMTGYGEMEETRLMADLWSVSRDRLPLNAFLATHGFHGPAEGEVSSRSWREDPSPILSLVETYRGMDESSGPRAVEQDRMQERGTAVAELLSALPWFRRPAAKVVLGAARRYIPLREVGKTAFLQALDVARASARVLGEDLAERGVLGDPEDVFYLTVDELDSPPAKAKELVAFRRERREEYLGLRVPDWWTGMPEAIRPAAAEAAQVGEELTGVAGSPGVVEGRARVVLDPSEVLEPGEILVCETTDPSWTSLFLVAAGLVIDIGGPISHGAIVARELGVPCVINTRTGTRRLQTGDLLRVDGSAGVVQVLEKA
jgi:phosphohistidine swiveling domain-containing protein